MKRRFSVSYKLVKNVRCLFILEMICFVLFLLLPRAFRLHILPYAVCIFLFFENTQNILFHRKPCFYFRQFIRYFLQVRGNETALETCTAAVDIPGNKMDISATIGEEFDVIRKDKTPNNKWLVRNKQGHCTVICIFFKTKC